eukprot:15338172-Ditylum_brightwellii.AAC.1
MVLSKLDDFVDDPKLPNLLLAAEIIQHDPTYQPLLEGTNSTKHDVIVAQEVKQKIQDDIAILQNELLQQRNDANSTTRTNRNSASRIYYSAMHTGCRRISNDITKEGRLKAAQYSLIAADDEFTAWKEDNDFLSVDKWIAYGQKVLKPGFDYYRKLSVDVARINTPGTHLMEQRNTTKSWNNE